MIIFKKPISPRHKCLICIMAADEELWESCEEHRTKSCWICPRCGKRNRFCDKHWQHRKECK